jgi:hypothetical protein
MLAGAARILLGRDSPPGGGTKKKVAKPVEVGMLLQFASQYNRGGAIISASGSPMQHRKGSAQSR